jgi:uncharacterized protein (DUF2062 family)
MPKKFFNKWLPSSEKVASLKFMRIFGERTLNPLLWYVNRRSIAKAMFIGTFWGILPVPFHSLFIILTVLWFEVNLPIGLCMAWLTNPLTVVPILYLGFWFGTKIYHVHMINSDMLLGFYTKLSIGLRILVMVILISALRRFSCQGLSLKQFYLRLVFI